MQEIQNWIFDLDNTIYPVDANIQQQADQRMPRYIMDKFGVDYDAARKIQKDLYLKYGTTLSGLVEENKIDPYHYWNYVFDIDYTGLKHDLALAECLSRLPGKKYIYSNSPRFHADKVLGTMGIADYFDGVFDLAAADFISKPQADSYRKMISYFGLDPSQSLFMDDVARNLVPAAQLGITTVYLQHGAHHPDFAIPIPDDILPYIHYQTDDMLQFLQNALLTLDKK